MSEMKSNTKGINTKGLKGKVVPKKTLLDKLLSNGEDLSTIYKYLQTVNEVTWKNIEAFIYKFGCTGQSDNDDNDNNDKNNDVKETQQKKYYLRVLCEMVKKCKDIDYTTLFEEVTQQSYTTHHFLCDEMNRLKAYQFIVLRTCETKSDPIDILETTAISSAFSNSKELNSQYKILDFLFDQFYINPKTIGDLFQEHVDNADEENIHDFRELKKYLSVYISGGKKTGQKIIILKHEDETKEDSDSNLNSDSEYDSDCETNDMRKRNSKSESSDNNSVCLHVELRGGSCNVDVFMNISKKVSLKIAKNVKIINKHRLDAGCCGQSQCGVCADVYDRIQIIKIFDTPFPYTLSGNFHEEVYEKLMEIIEKEKKSCSF